MRTIIQRVNSAKVIILDKPKSAIDKGLLILLGIEDSDTKEDISWLAAKIANLRIFNDENEIMNLSVRDVNGELMVISQFTLHASTKKGNRPSYIRAAKPETAVLLYEDFIKKLCEETGKNVKTGEFGAYMKVQLENDGPVTIVIDTKNKE